MYLIRLIDKTGGGCGFKGGFIPAHGKLDITYDKLLADAVQLQALATAGSIEVFYSTDNGTTWVGAHKESILSMAYAPESVNSLEQVTYIDMQATSTVVNLVTGTHAAGSSILAAVFTGAQPNCPRNLKMVFTGANSTFPLTVQAVGYDAQGREVTESFYFTVAATKTGVVAFAYVSSIYFVDTVTTGDTISVQLATLVGLPFPITADSLRAVYINGGYEPASDFTVDIENATILETGQTITASDDYVIYAAPNFAHI